MANRRMLHRNVSVCEQLADCSLLARLLYTWGLPHTSDYGVLAASPRRLKAQVFPIASETPEEIGVAADELVSAGLWIRFHDGESDYVCYPTFDKYQDLHKRTGRPRDGLPIPPTHSDFPELPGTSGQCPAKRREVKRSEEKRTEENPREEQPSSETAGSDPGSSDPAEDLRMAKQDKARKDATRMREQTEKLDLTLSALSAPDRALLDRMLAGQQLDPKRAGKPLTLLQQANQAEIFAKELLEHGPDCWRACCEIACGREVYTAEFARGCTKNWKPTSQDPFGGGGYGKQQRLMGPMPASAFGEIAPRPTE